jgi:phenylpyruvate tautomerase PptA (4-oxalocrotonate tautomerase family)
MPVVNLQVVTAEATRAQNAPIAGDIQQTEPKG